MHNDPHLPLPDFLVEELGIAKVDTNKETSSAVEWDGSEGPEHRFVETQLEGVKDVLNCTKGRPRATAVHNEGPGVYHIVFGHHTTDCQVLDGLFKKAGNQEGLPR